MNRGRSFDDLYVLRLIATIAVIAIHTTSQGMTLSFVGYYGNQLARFSVPMFLILSGFLLFQSDLNNGLLPRSQFYRKRFRRILLPYILWTIFYSLVLHYYFNGTQNANMILPDMIRHFFLGNGFTHLYFVVIIIQLYLLYPFMRRAFNAYPGLFLLLSLFLSFGCQLLLYLHAIRAIHLSVYHGEIYLIAFPVWLFYFVLGMFLALNDQDLEKSGQLSWLSWAAIWALSFALLLWDSYKTASFALSLKPTVILYATASFFFLRAWLNRFPINIGLFIKWFSDQSFLIYLLHPLMANALVFISLRVVDQPLLWSSNLGALAKFLITLVVTIGVTYIISLTPLAAPLGGARKK
ncbi:MAG: acyltransferase [Deltaproteobacteria bacterium]